MFVCRLRKTQKCWISCLDKCAEIYRTDFRNIGIIFKFLLNYKIKIKSLNMVENKIKRVKQRK